MSYISDDCKPCGTDLADKEGYGGKLSSSTVVIAGANEAEFVIINPGPKNAAGSTIGSNCGILRSGPCLVYLGATVLDGAKLQTNASGEWITAVSGDSAIVRAKEAGDSGDYINAQVEATINVYPEA